MIEDLKQEINWQEQLLQDEIGEDKETKTKFVYLKGLRRLSKIKGILKEGHTFGNAFIWETTKKGKIPFVQMQYTVTFKDGNTYSDVADAHAFNIENQEFAVYPTAIAASRSEARALRKALGIDLVSKEELGYKGGGYEMVGQITPQQISLIKRLMDKRNLKSTLDVIKESITREDVTTLEDLTFDEAQKILKKLN